MQHPQGDFLCLNVDGSSLGNAGHSGGGFVIVMLKYQLTIMPFFSSFLVDAGIIITL